MTTSPVPTGRETTPEIGPIDYLVLEWPGRQPSGEAAPLLLDLVDRGVIRIIDIAFMTKDDDGRVDAIDFAELAGTAFGEFHGASCGILDQEELENAATALAPGTSAAVLIWENRWAAPVAAAMRSGGGEVVATGRIPIDAVLAALDATENTN